MSMNISDFIHKRLNSYSLKDPSDTYPKYSWTILAKDKNGWRFATPRCGVDASKESIACDLAKHYHEDHDEIFTDYEAFIKDVDDENLMEFINSHVMDTTPRENI